MIDCVVDWKRSPPRSVEVGPEYVRGEGCSLRLANISII